MNEKLIRYIAEYLREEHSRCVTSTDFECFLLNLEEHIKSAVDAYEGGAAG